MNEVKKKRKIAVLGGGVGALTAAAELAKLNANSADKKYEITVYQMGWRLGGKGATGRNLDEFRRIEEHGLHVWLGFYDNAFRIMRECYSAMDRKTGPIRTWEDAFKRKSLVVFDEFIEGEWSPWTISFPESKESPGDERIYEDPRGFAISMIKRILEFMESRLDETSPHLSDADQENEVGTEDTITSILLKKVESIIGNVAGATLPGKLIALIKHEFEEAIIQDAAALTGIIDAIERILKWVRARIDSELIKITPLRRALIGMDMAGTVLLGIWKDRLYERGFQSINDRDFLDWLRGHGASAPTVNSAPLRSVYDLVFGYEKGSLDRPRLEAGTALYGMLRMIFTYRGAIFWEMQSGMGEIVVTPIYEFLRKNGVKFRFFNKIKNIKLSEDRSRVENIDVGIQVRLREGVAEYQPLFTVRELPGCWPDRPFYDQLNPEDAKRLVESGANLESAWSGWKDVQNVTLRKGVDFDDVILGISHAGLSEICTDFIRVEDEAGKKWKLMLEKVATVRTQALQLWMDEDIKGLGWTVTDKEPILGAYRGPHSTWASQSSQIKTEDWPDGNMPVSLHYFCGPLEDDQDSSPDDVEYPVLKLAGTEATALQWIRDNLPGIWPKTGDPYDPYKINWELFHDPHRRSGEERMKAQYVRANIDPSERYTLSLPDTSRYRLDADNSCFSNLYLTGDWVRTTINAGCVEAAVLSGLRAARGLSGEDIRIMEHKESNNER